MEEKEVLRFAIKEDMPAVLALIEALALYEKAIDEVEMTVAQLEKDGFGADPLFQILVMEVEKEIVGMSFSYFRYSTWKGKTWYLEDLIVLEAHRGKGYGKKLFDATLMEAKKAEANRLEWQVLDWNQPAIDFYNQQGATLDNEWINCRFTKSQIEAYKSTKSNDI